MEENEIICKFDKNYIHSIFFDNLDENEKADIIKRLVNNSSLACGFEIDGKLIFCVILDFNISESILHVRQVGGIFNHNFTIEDGYKILNVFCDCVALVYKLKYVTFHGERLYHHKMCEKFGFEKMGENDFKRVVH